MNYSLETLRSSCKTEFFSELWNKWEYERGFPTISEAEQYIEEQRRGYNISLVERKLKKDGSLRLIIEFLPMWPAEEDNKWEEFHRSKFGRDYLHAKICPTKK